MLEGWDARQEDVLEVGPEVRGCCFVVRAVVLRSGLGLEVLAGSVTAAKKCWRVEGDDR